MENILTVFGKFLASFAKGYGKQTAKKREKEDTKASASGDQKAQKGSA